MWCHSYSQFLGEQSIIIALILLPLSLIITSRLKQTHWVLFLLNKMGKGVNSTVGTKISFKINMIKGVWVLRYACALECEINLGTCHSETNIFVSIYLFMWRKKIGCDSSIFIPPPPPPSTTGGCLAKMVFYSTCLKCRLSTKHTWIKNP